MVFNRIDLKVETNVELRNVISLLLSLDSEFYKNLLGMKMKKNPIERRNSYSSSPKKNARIDSFSFGSGPSVIAKVHACPVAFYKYKHTDGASILTLTRQELL